jgi:hypothetical protein
MRHRSTGIFGVDHLSEGGDNLVALMMFGKERRWRSVSRKGLVCHFRTDAECISHNEFSGALDEPVPRAGL